MHVHLYTSTALIGFSREWTWILERSLYTQAENWQNRIWKDGWHWESQTRGRGRLEGTWKISRRWIMEAQNQNRGVICEMQHYDHQNFVSFWETSIWEEWVQMIQLSQHFLADYIYKGLIKQRACSSPSALSLKTSSSAENSDKFWFMTGWNEVCLHRGRHPTGAFHSRKGHDRCFYK